ncbi:hypothetical protein A3SI_04847 [Nitritalea halalkaliphila LW7]|uniref:Uncharacterized protein n=1 Tax=Nitritalea halalkaliphila LW7 TaxID=1189621 RepID=I5C8E6_9BACT|nr:hypothetical protein [Nitritalea halalkaliphila]EIM78098.1 hypothetical protein A3SI_04847 [Nitritalea halalkaliphila LW7]
MRTLLYIKKMACEAILQAPKCEIAKKNTVFRGDKKLYPFSVSDRAEKLGFILPEGFKFAKVPIKEVFPALIKVWAC